MNKWCGGNFYIEETFNNISFYPYPAFSGGFEPYLLTLQYRICCSAIATMFRGAAATFLFERVSTAYCFTKTFTQDLLSGLNTKFCQQSVIRKHNLSILVENAKNIGEGAKNIV